MNQKPSVSESRSQRNKRMIAEMSNARTFAWVGVAFVIHAVIIVGSSFGYIREHVFHMKPAEAKAPEENSTTPAPAAPAPADKTAAAVTPATPPAPGTAAISDDDKKLAERKDSPMVKSITDTPKPGEQPKGPNLNPLDLNDKP